MVRKNPPRRGLRPDWPALLEAVRGRLPASCLDPRALAVIAGRPAREPVAIACSGGADSVACVLALLAAFPRRRGRWLILHFDHRLRGRASTADAAFVRRMAESLGEPVRVGRRVRGSPRAAVSEDDARRARHGFFAEAMRAAGARVLALGHQLDDVAETMLMRLCRGAATAGLAAPRPVRPIGKIRRVRPLLGVSAAWIRGELAAAGVPWREDATNSGDAFFRNRVRNRVLPALVAASPGEALAGFALSRRRLEEDDEALEAAVAALLPGRLRGAADLAAFVGRPRALVRRAVDRWAGENGLLPGLGRSAMEELVAVVAAGGRARLSAGVERFVVVEGGRLRLERASSPRPAGSWSREFSADGEAVALPDGGALRARSRRLTPALRRAIRAGRVDPAGEAWLDAAALSSPSLHARPRRAGDRFRPLGAPGSASLQDLMVNRRIPRERRGSIPVITSDDGVVVWLPGFPPAEAFAVQTDSIHVVQLTYHPPGTNVTG